MSGYAIAEQPTPIGRLLAVEAYASAGGDELRTVEGLADELRRHYHDSLAVTYREAVLAESFQAFAEEWREATRFESSLSQITAHPAYRAIVQLGEDVVPLLLREVRRQPEAWFAALREITRADPVKPDERGDMEAMSKAWLRWGRERGLLR